MQNTSTRLAGLTASFAMILSLAACGGGEGPAEQATQAPSPELNKAPGRTPPPPPPPATDSTLALASASAAGLATSGDPCGVSADGGKVLFSSSSDKLVSGDSVATTDLFLKNFNGNGITRVVVATALVPLGCLALTPDANSVVYTAAAPNGVVDGLGNMGVESAIWVKNLTTGIPTRISPLLSTFPNVSGYQFAGVSEDGLRVAFIAQPTRTCSGYDCTATGPARMLLRNLATGALVNLENQVRFTTSQGVADGDAWLSPNGQKIAFSSRAAYPEAGDTNPGSDVFALDIASGNVTLVNTDAAGRQVTFTGFFGAGPTWGVQSFLVNSSKVAFFTDYATTVGAGGVYVKDLGTAALTRVLDRNLTYSVGNRAALSFSDDGRRVAYVESSGGGTTASSLPRVLDLTTGLRVNAATLSNGTVSNGRVTTSALMSRDGRSVAFGNNGTNLLGAPLAGGGAELRAYRKFVP